jgi:hypothetical protein
MALVNGDNEIMKKSVEECRDFALEIVEYYPRVLPATAVISEANSIAMDWLKITEVARSRKGHSIQLMSEKSTKNPNALLYGFPDPGEAVGGTGLLCLMKALKANHPFLEDIRLNWNFIPCLNLDDQPDNGKSLSKVMKTSEQEVDWLVRDPRPETTALLEVAAQLQPRFIFPLHDEWHCHEEIPCYMPVSRPLARDVLQGLRTLLESFGLKISKTIIDPDMGEGFLNMGSVAEIKNSTFYEFDKSGTVFICEVPDIEGQPDSTVVAAQIAAGLFVAANVI